ncbi:inositol monophosphatase family protein [Solicola gregarius]|uniref:Inositol-1-monophosphatase n=1 Tax=Solicola gregarius TaxID=2908642 RepID=A0AA46YK94_9ACTN|nr:inositol monophosphatase family protein [Solicola gregarius]UYM05262.1 inositol monophosphatase [Solicola gregarius]
MTSGSDLHELARSVARTAAEFVRAQRPEGRVDVAATKSSDTDVVTEIDRATEELIRTMIGAARPADSVIGEEGGQSTGDSDVTWIVDPIDGTVNFVHGLPGYSVSVAAAVGGVVETGCVVDVVSGEEFAAVHGGGATRTAPDGTTTRLGPPPVVALEHALIGTGFHYRQEIRSKQGVAVARLLSAVADVRRIGSAAIDLCNVASGRLDGYVEEGLKPWDLAAGRLIAEEAGVVVTGLDGEPNERLTVASAPSIAPALLAAVRESGF